MSNLMSDSEAGSEWGAWLEQGAPHAATESMGMAGAAPMALVGQVGAAYGLHVPMRSLEGGMMSRRLHC